MRLMDFLPAMLLLGLPSAYLSGNLTLVISHGATVDYNQTFTDAVVNGSWFFTFNFTPVSGTDYNFSYLINNMPYIFPETNTTYHPFGAYAQGSETSTTYYPNTTLTTGGTNTTSNITLMDYYDSLTYNITEGNGADPLTLYINYTNVTSFSQWVIREYYLGSASHNIQFEIYDYGSSTWESYFSIVGQLGQTWLTIPVYDTTDHISGGIVQTRMRHIENGITSHRLYVDASWLLEGNNIGASTNLAGYAKYQFGLNNFNGTGTMTAGQFNVSTTGYVNSNATCTRMCYNSTICMMIGPGC